MDKSVGCQGLITQRKHRCYKLERSVTTHCPAPSKLGMSHLQLRWTPNPILARATRTFGDPIARRFLWRLMRFLRHHARRQPHAPKKRRQEQKEAPEYWDGRLPLQESVAMYCLYNGKGDAIESLGRSQQWQRGGRREGSIMYHVL